MSSCKFNYCTSCSLNEAAPMAATEGIYEVPPAKRDSRYSISPFGSQNEIYGSHEKYGQLVNDNTH